MNANQKIFERNKSETVLGGALVRKINFFGGTFGPEKFCFFGGVLDPENLFSGDSLPPEKFYMSQYILRYMTVLYQSMYRKVKSEK